ncbi:hypothetical protein GQR58_029925 [Nymphon striatum]|nr:hypothetical protein GQR58_029925 [Nymphon striatum]
MKTVIDLSQLQTRVVSDHAEVARLRWFQLTRYFESGLLDELPTKLPHDPDVAHSTYFGIYRGNEIQATARIVKAPSGPPMLEHHELNPSPKARLELHSAETAEVSRLAVGRHTPHFHALSLLCREFFHHGVLNQEATLLLASVEKPLIRVLNRVLGIPVEIVGPPIDQYGHFKGATLPVLIDTLRCLDVTRRHASPRWEFFTEGLVMDLTELRDSSHEESDATAVSLPSISEVIVQPGSMNTRGRRPTPTPSGVPVKMTSPGRSSTLAERYSISSDTSKIRLDVRDDCSTRSSRRQPIAKSLGSATSSRVVSHGPIGEKLRRLLPRLNCAGVLAICRRRSLMSCPMQ